MAALGPAKFFSAFQHKLQSSSVCLSVLKYGKGWCEEASPETITKCVLWGHFLNLLLPSRERLS